MALTRTDGGTLTARVGPVGGTDGEDEGDGAAATVTLAEGTPRGPVLHRLPLAEVRQAVVEVEFKPAPSSEVDALVAAALEQGSGQGAGDARTGRTAVNVDIAALRAVEREKGSPSTP